MTSVLGNLGVAQARVTGGDFVDIPAATIVESLEDSRCGLLKIFSVCQMIKTQE